MAAQGCWLFWWRFSISPKRGKNNRAQLPIDVIVPYNNNSIKKKSPWEEKKKKAAAKYVQRHYRSEASRNKII